MPLKADEVETIIVGGGFAGIALARELVARGGSGVLVLEAGRPGDTLHVNRRMSQMDASKRWLCPEQDDTFWQPWTALRPPHYAGRAGLRAGLGGRGLYWHGTTLEIDEWALASGWPAEVVADLCGEAGVKGGLYAEIKAELAGWKDAGGALVGRSPAHLGMMSFGDTPQAVRRSRIDPTRWFAYTPLDYWRDPDSGAPLRSPVGVEFRPGWRVDQLIVERQRVVGVHATQCGLGSRHTIRGEHVVLAAGTVPSAALALMAWRDADAGLHAIGGLTDHLTGGVATKIRGSAAEAARELLGLGNRFTHAPKARSNIFVDLMPIPATGELLLDVQVIGEQTPDERNQITISDDWLSQRGRTFVSADLRPADHNVREAQTEILQELWTALVEGGVVEDADLAAEAQRGSRFSEEVSTLLGAPSLRVGRPHVWTNCLGNEDHESGSLAMGAATTANHAVNGLDRLYAVGPSVFPRAGAANPGLTILALARRLARLIAG